MKVHIQGQSGEVSLSQSNFVASGGEGQIYALGSTAFKIYTDPKKMIPLGKIQELAGISDPDVIKPDHAVLNAQQKPIGYTMRFLSNTLSLCQIFPPAFRQRNLIAPQMTLDLVRTLQKRISNIHQAHVLVVDANELNFLVDNAFHNVYAIDVDSYQTAHYPATAIMPSVRDPLVHGTDFTELSDWYSFAIISFNLFTGIHPYKGSHPSVKGMEDRMKAGISVFNSEVHMPKMVLPFSVIPDTYLQWYKAILEQGKRIAPPDSLQPVLAVLVTPPQTLSAQHLQIGPFWALGGAVLGAWEDGSGGLLVSTSTGLYDRQRRLGAPCPDAAGVGFAQGVPVLAGATRSNQGNTLLAGAVGRLWLHSPGATVRAFDICVDQISSTDGRIYVKSKNQIIEIVLTHSGSEIIASPRLALNCLEHATQMYPGVVLQDLLGARWASLLDGPGTVYQIHLKELDGYKVLDARYEHGVLMVITHKAGHTDRWIFRFDESRQTYDVRMIHGIIPSGLNFVVLDTGVVVSMTEEDHLELFKAKPGASATRVVEDKALGNDMGLTKYMGQVLFHRGTEICTLKLN